MAQPRVLILRSPGANCDLETDHAFTIAGGIAERVHVNRLLESPGRFSDYQIACIPGGFSYGDDISAGRILGSKLSTRLGDELRDFREQGKLILGICNGFQVLMRTNLLVDTNSDGDAEATLTWNDSGRYKCRWVHLAANGDRCVFLRGIHQMYLPIAHAEGKFVARDGDTLGEMDQRGSLALRYCQSDGGSADGIPDNPNGSQANVAGICDKSGRVFGLMPHPERHIDPTHHPHWTRLDSLPEVGDGFRVFKNAVEYFT